MFAKPAKLFGQAFNMQYAIGAFNVSNMEFAQAVIWAAEAKKSPVIVQTSEGAIEYASLPLIVQIVKQLAETVTVPVVLHLDHGQNIELIKACIDAGFTSVMIDMSKKSLAENISHTRDVVSYAHDRGVWVEAELGAILGTEGAIELAGERTPDDLLTNPKDAKQFVTETGVDSLAVSVGTIHGAFSGQEYIRFETLQEIESILPTTPLVVHGASGIAPKHLQEVALSHVCKINIDTELRIAFDQAVRAYTKETHAKLDPREMLGAARDAVQKVVEEKMVLFGSAGKATLQ